MNIIVILLPEHVFYKAEPVRELAQALADQGYHIVYPTGSQDLLTLLEQNPRIAGIIFDWEQYGMDLCLAINEINEYLPLYAFISTHSVLDVSANEMRMALYYKIVGMYASPAGSTVLIDRNCHKSLAHLLLMSDVVPIYLTPSRNAYGILGGGFRRGSSAAQASRRRWRRPRRPAGLYMR